MRSKLEGGATQGATDEAKEEEGPGFPVGATLVARWMGKTERTCVVIDRSTLEAEFP
jgi:hypothetical protein